MDLNSYITQLNAHPQRWSRSYEPIEVEAKFECLSGIKAVYFDVYGTLIDCYREEFSTDEGKQQHIMDCFARVIEDFNFKDALFAMNPEEDVAKTLRDLYHGLIYVKNEENALNGVDYPEIVIEDIWQTILLMLARNGYEMPQPGWKDVAEMAAAIAYLYNFVVLGRRLYPGALDLLDGLKKKGIEIGLISNAQFYTLIDLSWLMMAGKSQSSGKANFFSEDNTFFSYQFGVSKPNSTLFMKALEYLQKQGILPNQILYLGNDILNDICGAHRSGMKAALYSGDKDSVCLIREEERESEMTPDLVVESLPELLIKLK